MHVFQIKLNGGTGQGLPLQSITPAWNQIGVDASKNPCRTGFAIIADAKLVSKNTRDSKLLENSTLNDIEIGLQGTCRPGVPQCFVEKHGVVSVAGLLSTQQGHAMADNNPAG